MNATTWILIANASHGVVMATNRAEKQKHWTLIETFEHPESREKGIDLVSDRPGMSSHGSNNEHRSGMEPAVPPKELEADKFAAQLAHRLRAGLDHHDYERLVLVAPPHFLGLVRGHLDHQVAERVTASLDKDYSHLRNLELRERLGELI